MFCPFLLIKAKMGDDNDDDDNNNKGRIERRRAVAKATRRLKTAQSKGHIIFASFNMQSRNI